MADEISGVEIFEVIAVIYVKGTGTPGDPVRRSVALFEKSTGARIADIDGVDSAYSTPPDFLKV